MADFLTGPKTFTFPLWRGQDTAFTIRRKHPTTGAYVDYPENTTAKIVFTSSNTDYEFNAVIDGHEARFSINDDDVVNVRTNSVWRLQFNFGGADRTPVNGKVVRKDAK